MQISASSCHQKVFQHSGIDAKNQGEKLTYAATNQESKKSLTVVPDAPIEEILDYINEKDIAAAQAAASKAAKRARQKLRKQVGIFILACFCLSFFFFL